MSVRGKLSVEELALAFLTGLGILLMMAAGGFSAALAETANPSFYGLLFWIGMFTFVAGVVLWLVIVRPWTQFDDITVAKDTGHHEHEEHD